MIGEEVLTQVEAIYDEYDAGTVGFLEGLSKATGLSKTEVARIGWKARTANEFVRLWSTADWWTDANNFGPGAARIETVTLPVMTPETFKSLYRGSVEMRNAGCECRTTEEIFRRMLVVWCAQNGFDVDETFMSHDDSLAYEASKKKAA